MFDVGFWELVMVGVVALVVIGPKDLPRVARLAGLWLGRARRTLTSVKDEIDRELRAQELKEILEKQARSNPLETILEPPRKSEAASTAESKATAAAAPAVDSGSAPPRESPDR
jgi:sec-independent protein translocase protein TatB